MNTGDRSKAVVRGGSEADQTFPSTGALPPLPLWFGPYEMPRIFGYNTAQLHVMNI